MRHRGVRLGCSRGSVGFALGSVDNGEDMFGQDNRGTWLEAGFGGVISCELVAGVAWGRVWGFITCSLIVGEDVTQQVSAAIC